MGGFAWPWVGACLLIVPLRRLLPDYIPYLELGHDCDPSMRPGLRLVARRAAVADVRLPLRPAGRPSSALAVVELAARPEAGLVLQPRYDDRRHGALIYNGGNPILFWAGIPAIVCCGVAGLAAPLARPRPDRGGLRVPVPAVDADRARDLHVPLPDRGPLRDDRDRLRRRRAAAPSRLAGAGDRLPGAGGGRRRPDLPARLGARRCRTGTSTRPAPSRRGTTTSSSPTRHRASVRELVSSNLPKLPPGWRSASWPRSSPCSVAMCGKREPARASAAGDGAAHGSPDPGDDPGATPRSRVRPPENLVGAGRIS